LLGLALFAGFTLRHPSASQPAKQESKPTIEKQPVSRAIHTFDPVAPPADMPPLAEGEEAECDSNFVSNASLKAQTKRIDAAQAVLTVTEVKVTLQLKINIWVPQGATQHVMEHEQGHQRISEHYYQNADHVAEQIAAPYLGQQVSISGADLDAEAKKSLQKMSADITAQYNRRLNPGPEQQRFDDITDHSRNDVSASYAVTQAIKDTQ
jgi:hypothetical protein